MSGNFHQFGGLAPVQKFSDPARLLALDALEIKLVAGAHEQVEAVPELFEVVGKGVGYPERFGRNEPVFFGEETLFRKGVSDGLCFL